MKLGRYEVTGELGRGGMGIVYRARSPEGRDVAIKVLTRQGHDALARFARERRLLASFTEEDGFVPLLDVGGDAEAPWLVMPLLTQGTLRDRFFWAPLPVHEVVEIARSLAGALARAHALGIVHRDLKPENVLYSDDLRPLVSDLGLAKHFRHDVPGATNTVSVSGSGDVIGTVGFMAPEQLKDSKSVGPQADVFALGAILYEALLGKPAFDARDVPSVLARFDQPLEAPRARRPETPRWLDRAIVRSLSQKPQSRFADGRAFLRAIERGPGKLGRLLAWFGAAT